ncbi:MAG: prolipoprotein diacylglyceryl transferase [candidate division SR1 bacterium]|nr:prolipoprotein diacylglyceryl transferase [candidate division SR1 bacterium]
MIAFSIGPVHIYRYGIMYLLGFVFGYLGFRYIAKKKYFEIKFPRIQHILEKELETFLIVLFLGVLIGGRLGHVIIYNLPYYLAHPKEIIAFRSGGMSFIGGLFGVVIGILAFRKAKRGHVRDLLVLFDILLVLLSIGIAFGRLGNYLNQELYGILVSDYLPRLGYPLFSMLQSINMFHVYPAVDSFLRVNTNWLALFFEGIVTFVIGLVVFRYQIRQRVWRPGLWSAIFLGRYSFVRFILEYFRADSQLEYRGRFTISQRFFIAFFLLACLLLRKSWRKK